MHHIWLCPKKEQAGVHTNTCLQALRVANVSPELPLFPPHDLEREIFRLNRCKPLPPFTGNRIAQHHNIFTDGSCTVRHFHVENVAAYAIIADCIQSVAAKQIILDQYTRDKKIPGVFRCCRISHPRQPNYKSSRVFCHHPCVLFV